VVQLENGRGPSCGLGGCREPRFFLQNTKINWTTLQSVRGGEVSEVDLGEKNPSIFYDTDYIVLHTVMQNG
jgi:hypothetical protein